MFSNKIDKQDKATLISCLISEDFVFSKFIIYADQERIYHLHDQICAPVLQNSPLEVDFAEYLNLTYCVDCMNVYSIERFGLPFHAVETLVIVATRISNDINAIERIKGNYDSLVEMDEGVSAYYSYIAYNLNFYSNAFNFNSLFSKFEIDLKVLYLKIEESFKFLKEEIKLRVLNTFYREYQPSLWDFTIKHKTPVFMASAENTRRLAQELFYHWVELDWQESKAIGTDVKLIVQTFTQQKLSNSKLEMYQIKNSQSELNAWLIDLVKFWVKDYLVLLDNKDELKFGVIFTPENEDYQVPQDRLINAVIKAYSFSSKNNRHLLQVPKLVGVWLKEYFTQGDGFSTSYGKINDVASYHSKEEMLSGAELWDPYGSGPLRNLESAIVSAKKINT